MTGDYELHRPLAFGVPTSVDEEIDALEQLSARLARLYDELATNEREFADLRFHIRTTEAELERRRFGLLRRAGLDDEGAADPGSPTS